MADPTWAYSDWETATTTSSARLTRLRLHIKEVADALLVVDVQYPGGKSHVHARLNEYLAQLRREATDLENRAGAANGTRVGFTQGRAVVE